MFNISKAPKYGLNVRKTTVPGLFAADDDDEDGGGSGNAAAGVVAAGAPAKDARAALVHAQLEQQRKQVEAQMRQHEASLIKQDPTLLEYDEVYDHLKERDSKYQEAKQLKQSIRGKPKYVEKLIHEAAKRKVQNDLWYEKKLQREEEAEREAFGATEQFVTPAYRKHLEELQRFEAEQAEAEKRDAATPQTMQGFYANMLGFGSTPAPAAVAAPKETPAADPSSAQPLPRPVDAPAAASSSSPAPQAADLALASGAQPPEKKHKAALNLQNALGLAPAPAPDAVAALQNASVLTQDAVQAARERYLARKAQNK